MASADPTERLPLPLALPRARTPLEEARAAQHLPAGQYVTTDGRVITSGGIAAVRQLTQGGQNVGMEAGRPVVRGDYGIERHLTPRDLQTAKPEGPGPTTPTDATSSFTPTPTEASVPIHTSDSIIRRGASRLIGAITGRQPPISIGPGSLPGLPNIPGLLPGGLPPVIIDPFSQPTPFLPPTGVPQCPEGFRVNPQTGECEREGFIGGVQRALPGGQTGTLSDVMGEPTLGAIKIPAIVPQAVGSRYSSDVMGLKPILACPTGMVLGKDNLCYVRGSIPRGWRKWPPRPKPPITAGDAKAIRRADGARKRVANLAKKSGFSCKRR